MRLSYEAGVPKLFQGWPRLAQDLFWARDFFVTLDHPIRRAALTGRAQQGWDSFRALERPTPEDRRWAGTCAAYLGEWDVAQRELEQAAQEGCRGAYSHLALIHRVKGNTPLALSLLERISPDLLEPLERCLYLLQFGAALTAQHQTKAARARLEEGLLLSFDAPEGELVRPGLALALGVVRITLGDHIAALSDLQHAKMGGLARLTLASGYRAVVLAHTRQFEAAHSELEAVRSNLGNVPVARDMLHYWSGTVLRLEGRYNAASVEFGIALEHARESGEAEIEAHALLSLSACRVTLSDTVGARAALVRAKVLCKTPGLEALLLLREGQFERSRTKLEGALGRLDGLGMGRDALYAELSLTDVLLAQGEGGPADLLNRCADRLHALGGDVALEAELSSLPHLLATLESLSDTYYAAVLRPSTAKQSPRCLELRVLGGGVLVLGGKTLKTSYSNAPLLLYYLLRNPGRSLRQLVSDLFPDRTYRQGTQQFYKIRLSLNALIPGLEIQNETGTGCRVLLDGLSLSVDALELKTLLERGEVETALERYATLLPNAESDWVEEERDQLMKFMTQMAVKSINDHYERGNFERCVKIAAHILVADPFDVVLNDLYLHALRELHGPMVAQQTAYQVREKFAREGLEPPYELEAFVRSSLN